MNKEPKKPEGEQEVKHETGCEIIGCAFYKKSKCTDPIEFIDSHTGESCCRFHNNAVEKKTPPITVKQPEKEKCNLINIVSCTYRTSTNTCNYVSSKYCKWRGTGLKPSEKVEGVEEILKEFGSECASCARDTTNCCNICEKLKKVEFQLRLSIAREVVDKLDNKDKSGWTILQMILHRVYRAGFESGKRGLEYEETYVDSATDDAEDLIKQKLEEELK